MFPSKFFRLILLCVALAACDAVQRQEIQVGASKDAVIQLMGQPETVWKEDGRELWDYPRGPGGTETMRMTIIDGTVKDIMNILTESNFAQIKSGMTTEQVRRMIGKPGAQKQYGNSKGGWTWEWRYMQNRVKPMIFTVDFDSQSQVTGTASVDPDNIKPQ